MRKGSLASLLALLPAVAVAQSLGTWALGAPMPSSRQEVGVGVVAGHVYVVAGFASGVSVNTVERYDAASDQWAPVASLPASAPLNHVGVAAAGGHLYAVGGLRQTFQAVDWVFRYDPVTDEWTEVAPLPAARGAMGVAAADGRIFAAGGLPAARNRDFAVYHPASDEWETLPPMPTGRDHLAAAAIGGRIHAVTGRSGGALRAAHEAYDLASGEWITLAPIPTPRGGIAAAVAEGRLLVFGGEGNPADPAGIFDETEEYDPLTDAWRALAPMPQGRHGIGAGVAGGLIVIPGGGPVAGLSDTARNDLFAPPPVRAGMALH